MCISAGINIQYLCVYHSKGVSFKKSNEFNRGHVQSGRQTKCTLITETSRYADKELVHVELDVWNRASTLQHMTKFYAALLQC